MNQLTKTLAAFMFYAGVIYAVAFASMSCTKHDASGTKPTSSHVAPGVAVRPADVVVNSDACTCKNCRCKPRINRNAQKPDNVPGFVWCRGVELVPGSILEPNLPLSQQAIQPRWELWPAEMFNSSDLEVKAKPKPMAAAPQGASCNGPGCATSSGVQWRVLNAPTPSLGRFRQGGQMRDFHP